MGEVRQVIAFLFDTETSGLIDNRTLPLDKLPSITEFYGCLVDLKTGEIISEIDELIRPPQPISAEITHITGITNDMLADRPPFSHFAEQIKTALETAPKVVAHNLSFDTEMVEIELERLGQTIAWPRLLCTVEATIHLKGFRLNLTGLHELLFGEGFPAAHRARNDVMAMLRCAVKLHEMGEI